MAAVAVARASRALAVKAIAVAGGSMAPVLVVAAVAVAVLALLLPGFMTGYGYQQQRQEALGAVCVSSPYQLGPVQPHVEQAAAFLGTKYGVETIGGYRPGNTYDYAGHPAGLAIDMMFPVTGEGKTRGQAAADFAQANAHELGIKYIIWYQQIWSVSRASEGWRNMADRGSVSANHYDHIHISFNAEPGSGDMQAMLSEACGGEIPPATDTDVRPVAGGRWALPSSSRRVTSPYGMRVHPVTGVQKLHTGTDYGAGCGTPMRAASAGTVSAVVRNRAYGTLITINHGGGIITRYAHAYWNDITVRAGDRVLAGQQIAKIGSSGYSTGCHLHFEVKQNGSFINPVTFLRKQGVGA